MKKILVGILFTMGLVLLSPSVSAENSISTYRMYNPNSEEYLYTRSVGERDNLKRYGGHYGGAAWQAPTSGTPAYRLYSRYNGKHFYTINAGERDRISHTGGMCEDAVFYSYNGISRVPAIRLYNKYMNWHHYTLDQNGKNIINRQGWKIERTSGYVVPSSALNPAPTPSSEKVLSVPVIWQGNTILCEGISLLKGLHYKGVVTNQNLTSFVNYMPRVNDNDPYHDCSDEWRHNVNGTYQSMMPGPVVKWAKNIGDNAVSIASPGTDGTKSEIRSGSPVITWITYNYATPKFEQTPWGRVVWNGHVILAGEFKNDTYHAVNPVFGAEGVSTGTYERLFNTTGMMVAVR